MPETCSTTPGSKTKQPGGKILEPLHTPFETKQPANHHQVVRQARALPPETHNHTSRSSVAAASCPVFASRAEASASDLRRSWSASPPASSFLLRRKKTAVPTDSRQKKDPSFQQTRGNHLHFGNTPCLLPCSRMPTRGITNSVAAREETKAPPPCTHLFSAASSARSRSEHRDPSSRSLSSASWT